MVLITTPSPFLYLFILKSIIVLTQANIFCPVSRHRRKRTISYCVQLDTYTAAFYRCQCHKRSIFRFVHVCNQFLHLLLTPIICYSLRTGQPSQQHNFVSLTHATTSPSCIVQQGSPLQGICFFSLFSTAEPTTAEFCVPDPCHHLSLLHSPTGVISL